MRFLYLATLAIWLLAGCPVGERGTPEACRYAVTQDLDAGRFDSALLRLDSRDCAAAMTAEELEINRAAAYIGKARYDVADLLLAVLETDGGDGEPEQSSADLRLLQALTGLGAPGGGVRFVAEANLAYGRMMQAFPGGIDDACRDERLPLLSRLQRDACFHSGLLAYARLARSFDLLLENQLAAFLGLVPLTCDNDRNASGVADEAEVSACALHARTRLDSGGGTCRSASVRDGLTTGAVSWQRIAGVAEVPFFEQGLHFATLVPVRVTVEAGGVCEGDREHLRLLQRGARVQLMVTDGLCETEITRSCDAPDPDFGCWPCPIPRVVGDGAMSVTETLLGAINLEAERWLPVLTPEDAEKAGVDLEEFRDALCEPADDECEEDDDGVRVTLNALLEYLRQ